jgi:hypothetical protein
LGLLHLDDLFHEILIGVLPLLAVAAFVPGYRRHRDRRVFYWSVPGFLLLLISIMMVKGNNAETWQSSIISILGSLMLIRAHVINRRLCVCCEAGHS